MVRLNFNKFLLLLIPLFLLTSCSHKVKEFEVSGIDICKEKVYNYQKIKYKNKYFYLVGEKDLKEILVDYKIMKTNLKNCAGIDCGR